tara:strand:+ start:535 stop:1203 length:669 start_codon:yes stop_codon:yes gene_type:complete
MGFLVNPYRFALVGWNFSDDDMEESWTLGNNTITSNKMNCNGRAFTSTVWYGSIDPLGSTASDTAWVLWTTINFSVIDKGSVGGNAQLVCLSDQSATSQSTNQDGIGIRAGYDFGADAKKWYARGVNGEPFEGGTGFDTAVLETGVDYYLQMIRLTSTTSNCAIYSDFTRDTLVEAETPTISSSTVNLRYIKMANLIGFNAGADMDSTVNGVRFANAVTEAP